MGISEFLDSGRKNWTLVSGLWTLDPGPWTLNTGRWMLDSGCQILDAEHYTVDIKTLQFKTVQRFGNNGAISTTSFLNSSLVNLLARAKQYK